MIRDLREEDLMLNNESFLSIIFYVTVVTVL